MNIPNLPQAPERLNDMVMWAKRLIAVLSLNADVNDNKAEEVLRRMSFVR